MLVVSRGRLPGGCRAAPAPPAAKKSQATQHRALPDSFYSSVCGKMRSNVLTAAASSAMFSSPTRSVSACKKAVFW